MKTLCAISCAAAWMTSSYSVAQTEPGALESEDHSALLSSDDVSTYSSPEELPRDNSVAAYVMQLQNLTSLQAVYLLQAMVPNPKPYTAFVPMANGNSVTIVERSSVIRELLDLKSSFDVSTPESSRDALAAWARKRRAQNDLHIVDGQIRMYKELCGTLPATLRCLVEKPKDAPATWRQLLQREALDPWGCYYIYRAGPDGEEFVLLSTGPDREEGTSDDLTRR